MVFLHEKAGGASPSPTVQRNSTPKASKRKSTLQRQFPSRITKRKPPCKSLRLISAATLFHSLCFTLHDHLFTCFHCERNSSFAPPLPSFQKRTNRAQCHLQQTASRPPSVIVKNRLINARWNQSRPRPAGSRAGRLSPQIRAVPPAPPPVGQCGRRGRPCAALCFGYKVPPSVPRDSLHQ